MSTGQVTRQPVARSHPPLDESPAAEERGSSRTASLRLVPPPRPRPRPMPSLRFRRLRALVLLIALILLIWGCVRLIGWAIADHPAPSASIQGGKAGPAGQVGQAGQAGQGAAAPPTSESASAALAQAVQARSQGIPGDTAVGTLDLGTKVTATYQPDKVFETASIVKLDILATLLLQTQGNLTQGQESVAKRMIRNSDNKAASALWKQIGGATGLAAANQQFGLTSTTPGTKARWGLTTTTVADQLRLLSVIFTEESPLDAESRGFVRTLMSEVAADQDWGVSAADDPGGSKAYVKNGWLPRSGGWIVNSIGQVEHAGHQLLVVGLSDGRPSEKVGISTLEGISADAAKITAGR